MKYEYIKPPTKVELDWNNSIFLAGSISGAHDWQAGAAEKLLPHYNVINPRRDNYDILDPKIEREQITWEDDMLLRSWTVMFWFSHETLAPITLFELAKMLVLSRYNPWRKIYIGIDPEYKRKNDVLIQTELIDVDISRKIKFNLEELCDSIIKNQISN